ncbi:MAG: hypothetical protein ACRC7C_01150 [Beijerinckiaceae bacterium]
MRYSSLLFPAALLLSATSTAGAQTTPRFTFQTVDGGVMRLDTETGQVSFCTRAGADIACRSVADDRAALNDEIDRLKRENERLKTGAAKPAEKFALPSDAEIDKAMGLFERLMRRMMRTMKEETAPTERL